MSNVSVSSITVSDSLCVWGDVSAEEAAQLQEAYEAALETAIQEAYEGADVALDVDRNTTSPNLRVSVDVDGSGATRFCDVLRQAVPSDAAVALERETAAAIKELAAEVWEATILRGGEILAG